MKINQSEVLLLMNLLILLIQEFEVNSSVFPQIRGFESEESQKEFENIIEERKMDSWQAEESQPIKRSVSIILYIRFKKYRKRLEENLAMMKILKKSKKMAQKMNLILVTILKSLFIFA